MQPEGATERPQRSHVLKQSGLHHNSEAEMKISLVLIALTMFSCGQKETQDQKRPSTQDETQIEEMILTLYKGYTRAYNDGGIDTDSLIDAYYDKGIRYVTSWGWTEPIDSTKSRLRNARAHVKNYSARVEDLEVKSYGTGACAFFILRQNTSLDGTLLEEYLPTTLVLERKESGWKIVHAHRSTDYETFQQYIAMQKPKSAAK
jgi:hypothetical protein